MPLRNPAFTPAQIAALEHKTFGQCVADVLNLLFQTNITAWDVDFSIGRYPVRLVNLRNRMVIAECWHNPDWCFQSTIANLAKLLESRGDLPGNWVTIAVRAAVLFGIFSELKKNGISQADTYQMYAYQKKYGAENVTLLYPQTEKMLLDENIEFTSHDGVKVRVKITSINDSTLACMHLFSLLLSPHARFLIAESLAPYGIQTSEIKSSQMESNRLYKIV